MPDSPTPNSLYEFEQLRWKNAVRIASEFPFSAEDVRHCLAVFGDEEMTVRGVLTIACHTATETPLLDTIDAVCAVRAQDDIHFVEGDSKFEGTPRGILNQGDSDGRS